MRGELRDTGRPGLLMSQYVSVSGHLRKMRRRYSISILRCWNWFGVVVGDVVMLAMLTMIWWDMVYT
jgi:hypothetical protein